MTENEINITDMIKALQCVASQDAEGDCYCDHFNAHLTFEQFGDNTRLDEKHMSCGGNLKDTQKCPYSQDTYGVCPEDGELFWLSDVANMLEELQQYRAIGTVEQLQFMKSVCDMSDDMLKSLADSIRARMKYEAIGSVEEFKALKEKNVAKKPNEVDYWGEYYKCPTCKEYALDNVGGRYKYCPNCGTKIDWQ